MTLFADFDARLREMADGLHRELTALDRNAAAEFAAFCRKIADRLDPQHQAAPSDSAASAPPPPAEENATVEL